MSSFLSATSRRAERLSRRRAVSAFTLIETLVGLCVFIIGGLGVMEVYGLLNTRANANRALTAARMLVNAKIAKAQTDTYTPNNKTIPVGVTTPTSGTLANQDTSDPFDFAPQNVTLVGSAATGPVIVGTMNQSDSTFEAASGTTLVTFTISFVYRGKTYTVTQSTVRAADQL